MDTSSRKRKLADNSYLIKVNVKSYNPRPYEPSLDILIYNLEYTTKDFLNFRLIRLKNVRSDEWIEVDELNLEQMIKTPTTQHIRIILHNGE